MATLEERPTIDVTITLSPNESEARALDAITSYGDEAFLKAFYEGCGTYCLKKHEDGAKALFKAVRNIVPAILGRLDKAREVFSK